MMTSALTVPTASYGVPTASQESASEAARKAEERTKHDQDLQAIAHQKWLYVQKHIETMAKVIPSLISPKAEVSLSTHSLGTFRYASTPQFAFKQSNGLNLFLTLMA